MNTEFSRLRKNPVKFRFLSISTQFKNIPQILIRQIADPVFARADRQIGKLAFAADHIIDAFFKSAAGDQAINHNVFLLTDAVARSVACVSTAGFHHRS